MFEWINTNNSWLIYLTLASAITFFAGLIIVPLLIVRIPADYFNAEARAKKAIPTGHNPRLEWIISIGRNILGLILVLGGILMLGLPGQGLLTILIGLMLMNFPGKYRLLRWIVRRKAILGSINWIRERGGKDPLILESDD